MLTNICQLGVLVVYLALVPGLPLALYLARRAANWRLILAFTSVLSIGANYFVLVVLNFLGVRPNLALFGVAMMAVTAFLLVRSGLPRVDELKAIASETLPILPAIAIGAFIWKKAFQGYLFIAANEDAVNHNRWIARIADVRSALTSDSMVDSPLQRLGTGKSFYPLAWHTDVAIGSQLSGLAVPTASMLSIALIWIVVLPAGLSALAKVWSPHTRHLGAMAALLSQLYPLVPGAPLAWGSMTTCAGIGLLPTGVIASVYMLRNVDRMWTFVAVGIGITTFFIHIQEAATLVVLVLVQFVTIGAPRLRTNAIRVAVSFAVFALPALWFFRDFVFRDRAGLRALFGIPQPSWGRAIGQFFSMDIDVVLGASILAIIFFVGLLTAWSEPHDRWMVYSVLALGAVYLVAGSGSGFLSKFRFFTAPWYASFERTLWVVVPFAALLSAYALVRLLPANVDGDVRKKAALATLALALIVVVLFQQVGPSVDQIRIGPERAAMIGAKDLDLIHEARGLIADDEIAISFDGDGTIYPYIYEGIRVTAGLPITGDGSTSDEIATIYAKLGDLCSSAAAMNAFTTEHVAAVFLAKRGIWGQPLWNDESAGQLRGLQVVRSGDLLILLVPNFSAC
ncbi:hypothetical protein BH10ACT2_BH10ACT2_04130 [soil metagenome]